MRRTRRNQELLTTLRSQPHIAELADGREFPVVSAYHTGSGVFVVVADGEERYHQQVSNTKGDAVPSVFLSPMTVQ